MSATVHFRGQMTPDHMVTSGAMKDAEGQKPGNTDRIDKTDQNWFSWMQNSGHVIHSEYSFKMHSLLYSSIDFSMLLFKSFG